MTLVYIASDNRSGSTLLDLLLGNHRDMASVGELRRLHEFQTAGERCTCGAAVSDCPFWNSVRERLSETADHLEHLPLKPPEQNRVFGLLPFFVECLLIGVPLRLLHLAGRFSKRLRKHLEAADNSWMAVDAIRQVTQCQTIVDSSKRGDHCKLLYFLRPQEFKMIYLIRDGRGVSCSRVVRKKVKFWRAAISWCGNNLMLLFLQAAIPSDRKIFLKYEHLCTSPERELRRVCDFLDLPFHEGVLHLAKHDRHNIGGSPRRLDMSQTGIELDNRWKRLMGRKEHLQFRCVGGWLNRYFGYR